MRMRKHTTKTRWLRSTGVATTLIVGIATAMLTASSARADVDPFGENAHFISIGKHNHCGTVGYLAEGYMVDDSGNRLPGTTWHAWDGTIRGCQFGNDKAVFAWEPGNNKAQIDLTLYVGDHVIHTQTIPGDWNYCLLFTDKGRTVNWSSESGGGSDGCTAD
jgi:hypothetical protein